MNNLEKFNETVGILVKAYLNDTLKHMECCACAVGNICGGRHEWRYVFCTDGDSGPKVIYKQKFGTRTRPLGFGDGFDYDTGLRIISETGYTVNELARIENAFETAEWKEMKEDDEVWMFNGLMAVVDVLAEIHNIDLSVKQQAKLLFAK